MSGLDDLTAVPQEQPGPSRRSVLRTAAGAGLAATALAATSAAPALAATRATARNSAADHHADAGHQAASEPIVVHLRDARTGEIDVFRGTSQTRLHDHALAAALIRASR
jgi:hypothetical protein